MGPALHAAKPRSPAAPPNQRPPRGANPAKVGAAKETRAVGIALEFQNCVGVHAGISLDVKGRCGYLTAYEVAA